MQQHDHAPENREAGLNIKSEVFFDQSYLINKLNYLNFIDSTIVAVYRHADYNCKTHILVTPLPCQGPELKCRWVYASENEESLRAFCFHHLLVSDGDHVLFVKAKLEEISDEGPRFRLPEKCHPAPPLENVRNINSRLVTQVFQKGVQFSGRMLDFSEGRLKVAMDFNGAQSSHWIDTGAPVYLVLSDGKEIFYSNTCTIEKENTAGDSVIFDMKADTGSFRRYQPKKYRNKRINLRPAPDAVFTHPLILKPLALKVDDISGLGFSMTARDDDSDILSGLIVPNIRLEMAGERLANCKAQVVHRSEHRDTKGRTLFRFGMAILDIKISEHTRLQRMLQQAEDPNAYVNGQVEQNALWDFFFKTGFIYPEKYTALEEKKEQVKETYRKLYMNQPPFSRHFIYQKKGIILGHMAILRFYSKAWLIHHHAAKKPDASHAGLRVMEQIGQFVNSSHTLDAMCMEYMFFFYRPENRFPSLLFGEAARFVKDTQKCSLDKFAYGHFQRNESADDALPPGWTLDPAQNSDLSILKAFYDTRSGGLMARAFDIDHRPDSLDELAGEYEKIGFQRKRLMFTLKQEGRLKAFFEVNLSDIGLNMSDLTNCIRLYLVDAADLPEAVLAAALNQKAALFANGEPPVLIYPAETSATVPVAVERHYMLWIMDLKYLDRYFAFMNRIVRFSKGRG